MLSHDAKLPKNVVAGYHAMALDERRVPFGVLRWNKNNRRAGRYYDAWKERREKE